MRLSHSLFVAILCSQTFAPTPSTAQNIHPPDAPLLGAPTSIVTVDWTKVLRTVDPKSYGVDCPACLDPAWSHNPAFLKALATVTDGGKPIIRLHGWGMVEQGSNECWLNPDNTWNAEKIKSALTPLIHAGYKLLIDIPSGPGGDRNVKELRNTAAMAAFAAALVKIINVDNHFDVKYWELPNEQEHTLNPQEMSALLSDASTAMKAVDPTILFGGPATDHIDLPYLDAVVSKSLTHLDFVSVHTYGGDGKQSDAVSYDSARKVVVDLRALRATLNRLSPSRYIPIFVDEYNIGYDPTPKIFRNEGAVYFSLIQGGVIEGGGDVSAVWDCSAPHNMSIVAPDGTLHDSANLFSLMNQHFYGSQVAVAVSNPSIYAYSVENSSNHSVLLSNLTDSTQDVDLRFNGWHPKASTRYQITSAGYSNSGSMKWDTNHATKVHLPANSVMVLTSQ